MIKIDITRKEQIKKRHLTLIGICIASFLGCIDLTVVNTILPAISRQFDISLNIAQWVTSSFMIALSAFMVPFGKLADLKGRRKVLYWGLGIFGVASLAVGLSTTIIAVILFRFLQGIGCAILYTVTGAIISNLYPENERGKAIGILLGVNGIGLAIGPIIGGVLTGIMSWHFVFFINIPFIIISYILCFISLEEQKGTNPGKIDLVGSLLLVIFLTTLVGFLSAPVEYTIKAVLISVAILSFITFYFYERKRTEPIIEFQLFKNKELDAALISTFFLAFYYSSVLLVMPMLFAVGFQETDLSIGLYLIPATALYAVCSPYAGKLAEQFSPKKLITVGLSLFVIAAAIFAYVSSINNILFYLLPLAIFGVGWSLILGPSTLIALASLPNSKASLAMGTSWTIHNVGGACGIAFSVLIIGSGSIDFSNFAYLMIYLLSLSVFIILVTSVLFYTRKRNRS